MSSHEFGEWLAFDRIERMGGPAEDIRTAGIQRTLANIWRDKKKKGAPYDLDAFIPQWDAKTSPRKRNQVTGESRMKNMFDRFARRWNKRFTKPEQNRGDN